MLQEHMITITHGSLVEYSPVMLSVAIGSFGLMMSKSAKYCFFDPTKEQVYIPIDEDLRTNGKAAVDGVGARLGKSCGAWFTSSLIMVTGLDIMQLAIPLACGVVALSMTWFCAVIRLHRLYYAQLRYHAQGSGFVGDTVDA